MQDPVARTRAMLHAEIADLEAEIDRTTDAEEAAEMADELEAARSHLASLDMCFA